MTTTEHIGQNFHWLDVPARGVGVSEVPPVTDETRAGRHTLCGELPSTACPPRLRDGGWTPSPETSGRASTVTGAAPVVPPGHQSDPPAAIDHPSPGDGWVPALRSDAARYAALSMLDDDWSWWSIPTSFGPMLYGYRVRAGGVLGLYIVSEDDAALVRSPAPDGAGYTRASLTAQVEAIRLGEP